MTAAPTEGSNSQELGPDLSAFVLTVSSDEGQITVTSSSGTNTCIEADTCNFAYLGGSALTIKSQGQNLPDCEKFNHWVGACAGQTATCNVVINSNLSTSAVFGPILGCVPK